MRGGRERRVRERERKREREREREREGKVRDRLTNRERWGRCSLNIK